MENNNIDNSVKKDKRKSNKERKAKIESIFSTIQWLILGLCFIFLILFNRSQPFTLAKNIFSIIIFVFLEIDLISWFIRIILTTKNTKQRILAFFAFIVNAILLLVCYLIRKPDISNLILFIYNTIFIGYYAIDYTLYKTKYKTGKMYNNAVIAPSLFVFIFTIANTFYHTYINSNSVYLYALIPMGIILIAFTILSFTLLKETYKKYFKSVIAKIGVVLMIMVCAYGFGIAFIDATNCAIKNQVTQLECVVVRKHFSNSVRGIDTYELYVMINDKEYRVNVSSDLYYDKEVNDTLKVNLYRGCLNLEYYESGEGY